MSAKGRFQPVATGSNHPIRSSQRDLAALVPKPSRPLKPSKLSPSVAALADSSTKQNDCAWPFHDRLVFTVNAKFACVDIRQEGDANR